MMYREDGLPAGTVVQGIEIQRLLRADRFVLTYLARDTASGRSLALKEYLPRDWGRRRRNGTVGPQTADTEHFLWGLARFLDEAHLAEQLAERDDDRYLVGLKRVFEDRGTAYVALEYEAVRTLEESTAEGLPEARVREVLSDIEAGLKCMHAAGLYHYDVTPSNVVVRADGKRVLMFACGRTRQEMARRCRTAAGVFSPAFAAAEQHDVQEGKDGPWTDIHALGALAYWALSGRAPAPASHRAENGLPAVAEVSQEPVSEGLAAAVDAALSTDVRERPQSLENWRARLTPREVEGETRPVPSSRLRRWLTAAAVAALVGLAVWAVVERQLRERAQVDIEQRAEAWRARESALNGAIRGLQAARQEAQDARRDFMVMHEPECDLCPPVIVLPGGTFTMGRRGAPNANPPHPVQVSRFALGQTEVTRRQYRQFAQTVSVVADARPCSAAAGNVRHPMQCVLWNEAQAYVEWLAQKTGKPYRLPSEAEWEYAARAGTTTRWYWGTDENWICTHANSSTICDGIPGLAPVRSFNPNTFGLFDMAGNVAELVADCWHDSYQGAPRDGTPWMASSGRCTKIVRGGSYAHAARHLDVTARIPVTAGRNRYVGFRVALSLE